MKTREFWIEFGGDPSDDKEVYKRYCATVPFKPSGLSDEVIHCREVVPIYWDKVWLEYHKAHRSPLLQKNREILQKIIENQLKGE